jgi:hypothetical protein
LVWQHPTPAWPRSSGPSCPSRIALQAFSLLRTVLNKRQTAGACCCCRRGAGGRRSPPPGVRGSASRPSRLPGGSPSPGPDGPRAVAAAVPEPAGADQGRLEVSRKWGEDPRGRGSALGRLFVFRTKGAGYRCRERPSSEPVGAPTPVTVPRAPACTATPCHKGTRNGPRRSAHHHRRPGRC